MRKLFIALLATLLASGAFAQTFPDIPENHWAEDAVSRIADLGIVIGFPDGTFRGNEAFTRYQASLVVSRLLDVINANMEAMGAMTEADIASLRNALQELASDLAAQGVRVAALESAVAGLSDDAAAMAADMGAAMDALGSDIAAMGADMGAMGADMAAMGADMGSLANSVAGLDDDVASNSARISDLEDAVDAMAMKMDEMGDMDMGMPEGMEDAMRDLQNQIAALRVGVDTAAAQAEAAGAQAAAAADDAAAAAAAAGDASTAASGAAAQASENAGQIAAVNSVLNLFNDRLAALESAEPMAGGDTIINQVDDEAIARNASDIANIREFVILLRRDQVALRDSVSALQESDAAQAEAIADLQGRVTALEDNPLGLNGSISFDYYVGRVDGTPFDSDRAYGLNSYRDIGASTFSSGTGELDADDDDIATGEEEVDLEDITAANGDFDVSLDVNLRGGLSFDGYGSPNMLNSFSAVVEFDFAEITVTDTGGDDRTIYVLEQGDYILTADFVGMDLIQVILGEEVAVSFTDNVLDRESDGYSVYVGSPDFLAFANPQLWAFYLSNLGGGYYRGVRGTASFIDGVSGGVSAAQRATSAEDKDDVQNDNVTTTVLGVDAQASLGPIELVAEFATSDTDGAANGTILMAEVTVDTGSVGIPILDSLWAAYVDFDTDWFTNEDGLDDEGSHEEDQAGFYATADFDLFGLLALEAYVDSYSVTSGDNTLAFGVDASAGLPFGFDLTAFYHSAAVNSAAVDDQSSGVDANEAVVVADMDRDNDRDTGFGVGLNHDGDGANALIPNLNLEFAYEVTEADFSNTFIRAYADYELSISIVTLTPYVKYESDVDADGGTDDTTTIAAGTGLETAALDIFLAPSLEASVNYRTTDHSDADIFTSTELQYAVGLHLNEFLLDYTSLTVRYGSWTGTNIQDDLNTVGAGDSATDISGGDENNGGATQSVNGYEVILNFYDAEFAYGVYLNGDGSSAQAFTISYTIDW